MSTCTQKHTIRILLSTVAVAHAQRTHPLYHAEVKICETGENVSVKTIKIKVIWRIIFCIYHKQTKRTHTHTRITFITFYWEIRLLIFNWLNGVCLVWSWYYGPVCFLPRVSWLKNLPLSTRCQIDTTVWLIHTHKRTCHNPRPPIGYCRSPVSKATLECLVCGTTPFRKQPHVNKPAMCSTVCSIWLCGKQSVTGCRQIEVDL